MAKADFLPDNVSAVPDRHGKIRYRYRRKGVKGGYLPGELGSDEWLAALNRFRSEEVQNTGAKGQPVKAHSFDDLARRYKSNSPAWKRQAESTKYTYSNIIERLLDHTDRHGNRWGDRPVAAVTVASIEKMLGKMSATPAAANNRRKVLSRLFDYAIKLDWRKDNPAKLADAYPTGKGFHTWTDAELQQYRDHHAYGTMARITMELALNVAGRRCEVAVIERSHIKNGRIEVEHVKGNNPTRVKMMPETRKALEAMPATPIRFIITGQHGKPYTVESLGNRFRKWCREAGLPNGCSIHGLRKAQSRLLAESGATDAQGRAVTGHTKNTTFAYYAAMAERERLADDALSNLENKALSNLKKD